jgi:ABC-type nitrate/sulfonate/bicarbonate transport system ATPase subunit
MSDFFRAENISFSYPRGKRIIQNFTLTMERGECLGIQGPSGCGKSTFAQILAGHLRPQEGRILLEGVDITHRPQRAVFMVHQDNDLFPWLNVEKQIAIADPNPTRIKQLIELTKLKNFEKYYPRQLSGGMKKRLAIARALAVNPKVLIFDESFNSLDFEMRQEIFKDLKQIWRELKTSIIVISHDPRDIHEISEREMIWKEDARALLDSAGQGPLR